MLECLALPARAPRYASRAWLTLGTVVHSQASIALRDAYTFEVGTVYVIIDARRLWNLLEDVRRPRLLRQLGSIFVSGVLAVYGTFDERGYYRVLPGILKLMPQLCQ